VTGVQTCALPIYKPEIRVDRRQQPEGRHTTDGAARLVFLEDQHQFVEEPPAADLFEEIHPHGAADQVFGVGRNREPQTLLETDGTEDAGRVFHK